ncbi:MAG: hypothetical protein J0I20_33900 [Chloroflexi bacterium]|nr:hypothetical protein [Chloroflexota bacterium]OJW05610.1 MAG: hypothetical protein BGO39_03055 [Chloroflexi bacterium 54-19]
MRVSNELDYYETLERISKYDSPEKLKKNSGKDWGLNYHEALEMAYENVIEEAKGAIKGRRRPKKEGQNAAKI